MRPLFAFLAGLASACFVTATTAAPPIEAYGEVPEIRSLDFSPDGSRFAFFLRKEGRELMVVFETGKGNLGMIDVTDVKPRTIDFITNKHVIIWTSQSTQRYGGYEDYQASTYNIETGEISTLADRERSFRFMPSGSGGNMTPTDDPDVVFYTMRIGEKGDIPETTLVRGNLATGRASIAVKGSPYAWDWLVTNDGVVLAREDFNGRTNVYEILTHRNGRWQTVYMESGVQRPTVSLASYTPDREALLVWRDLDGEDHRTLHRLTFDGEISEPVYSSNVRQIDSLIVDPWGQLVGITYGGFKPSYFFLDPSLATAMNGLANAFPDDAVQLADLTNDFSKLFISVSGGATAPGYFEYDRETKSLSHLTSTYTRIKDEDVAPVKLLEYEARDGLVIPSLLTHPKGAKIGDKLPLIIYPHGGPEAYDSLGFHYRAQYFASRGYLVLQPNFRGSEGFGSAHRKAGYGEWGGKMQDDISDGVDYLVKSGWADPERACIMGASYGGYAALAGGAFTPDLYKCVVAIAPVSDMQDMVAEERFNSGRYSATMDYLRELLGDMMEDAGKLRAISPTNHAGSFKAPVLLMHGTGDTVVPYSHSTKMEKALRAAGKDVTFITLKGEDHWMSTSETRLQGLKEVGAFIEEHIGPAQ